MNKYIFIFFLINRLLCNWEQIEFPNNGVNGILFDNHDIYMIDMSGNVFQSSNNGESWSQFSEISNILPYGLDVFKKIGNYLLVMQNTFEGVNFFRYYFYEQEWEEIDFSFTNVYDAIHHNEELYVLSNNNIIKSDDYGSSWDIIENPLDSGYPHLLLVNESDIYINYGCNLFKASTSNYLWQDITDNLDLIGPPEPYICSTILDLTFFYNELIVSVYWSGGIGTLLSGGGNESVWFELESFPAENFDGYKYSVSDILFKDGVLYSGTATSQNGIFYTNNLIDWVEYSDGLESYDLSVTELYSTNENIFKHGGTVNFYKNNLVDILIENLGDINEDENIDILDVIESIGLILNDEYNILADMNYDGIVNILDIIEIIQSILNLS
tara:strand:- start:115 stop:1266 length:1152 start_codon:yes stop_codon:yes gene_type:complete